MVARRLSPDAPLPALRASDAVAQALGVSRWRAPAVVRSMMISPRWMLAAVRDPGGTTDEIAAIVPELAGSRYMLLTTTKRDGTRVATPVWFAAAGGQLVATSEAGAWKVKRLRHTPAATVAPCDVRGEPQGFPVPVVGTVIEDGNDPAATAALSRRYGAAFDAIGLVGRLRNRGRAPRRAILRFAPAR